MKTANDPRHIHRIKVMQELFAWDFKNRNSTNSVSEPGLPEEEIIGEQNTKVTIEPLIESITRIDEYLKQAAPAWPVENINKIDLAILRQAIFELLIEKKAPPKVIVDEAVELAKSYGSESSASFINGALGKLIAQYKIG